MAKRIDYPTTEHARGWIEYKHQKKITPKWQFDEDDWPEGRWFRRNPDNVVVLGHTPAPDGMLGFPLGIFRSKQAPGYRIIAGCRTFSPKQAQRHWEMVADAAPDPGTTPGYGHGIDENGQVVDGYRGYRAREMLKMLPRLHKRAQRLGWVK